MKPLLILIIAFVSLQVNSQEETTKKGPSLALGLTANMPFSTANYPPHYIVWVSNTSSGSDDLDKSLTYFLQAEGKLRWNKMYMSGALGVSIENIDVEATRYSSWANVGAGGSNSSDIKREIYIQETHTSFIGSLEIGVYFTKPQSRFQIGLGTGTDFLSTSHKKIQNNELIKTSKSTSTIDYPGNPVTTTVSSTESFDNQSGEWNTYVRNSSIQGFSSKQVITSSYRFNNNLSVSLNAQLRFSFWKSTIGFLAYMDFPMKIGIHYHLK